MHAYQCLQFKVQTILNSILNKFKSRKIWKVQNADSREIINYAEISGALQIILVKECKFALNYFAKGFSDVEAKKD